MPTSDHPDEGTDALMNTPVGPGGSPRRRRSDPSCAFAIAVVYAAALVIAVARVVLQ